jgi:hypothetical protein
VRPLNSVVRPHLLGEVCVERCIRCDGELEKGFLVDKGESDFTHQAIWASGEPNTAFFRLSVVKSGNSKLPITTYRCKSCGRLESFAHAAP